MVTMTAGQRIKLAREAVGMAQDAVEERTGISQSTLSRIESGARLPKMNEVASLALVLGSSVSELTGHSAVRERVQCAARATDDADMAAMRRELTHYLELDASLDDQGL